MKQTTRWVAPGDGSTVAELVQYAVALLAAMAGNTFIPARRDAQQIEMGLAALTMEAVRPPAWFALNQRTALKLEAGWPDNTDALRTIEALRRVIGRELSAEQR